MLKCSLERSIGLPEKYVYWIELDEVLEWRRHALKARLNAISYGEKLIEKEKIDEKKELAHVIIGQNTLTQDMFVYIVESVQLPLEPEWKYSLEIYLIYIESKAWKVEACSSSLSAENLQKLYTLTIERQTRNLDFN